MITLIIKDFLELYGRDFDSHSDEIVINICP